MPSVVQAVTNFFSAIVGIFISLINSVLAVFQAIFALGVDVVNSVFSVVKHLIAMVTDVFSGVIGFIAANFVAIAVLGGGYYAYTVYQSRNRGGVRKTRA
ncbi:hypothetical protein GALMADRAFT_82780 [Galerina marginata CBS 339.88]|uniref:Uncharacterized protein n=1 Tax=Galerina marginata (strain CBS 339.88) TaxID=685588 RepID=A0A067TXQ8_GALM3|nr:hypothetical protein GALMADRAFT_82780 [Galerina marginata CBS 339.88]